MVDSCIPVGSGTGFLRSTLAFVDCQAENLGQGGYQALTAPGSVGATATTAVLTVFVALFGYRLLLGERIALRDGVVSIVKVGLVLMLAASWPAFRTLVYDTTMHGPAELVATIAAPAALPGAGGGLVAQLQALDDGMAEFVQLGAGRPPNADLIAGPTIPLNAQQQQQQLQQFRQAAERPRWDPERAAAQIGSGRTIFLAVTIGAFACIRLLAGLLIALGPMFVLFLLFDATRGIFEAWVRGLGGITLAAVATSVVLGVELALVGPWLIGVVVLRRAGVATPSAPVELVALSLVFAVALVAVLIGTAKVAHGLRLPAAVRAKAGDMLGTPLADIREQRALRRSSDSAPVTERTRATEVAEAISAAQRREAGAAPASATRLVLARATSGGSASARQSQGFADTAVGAGPARSSRRRLSRRISAGATRRDLIA